MVKSRVASAHPLGNSDKQDDTAATSPATPTIEAGNCPGGPENLSSNGNSTTTWPGASEDDLNRKLPHEAQCRKERFHIGSTEMLLRVSHDISLHFTLPLKPAV